MSHSNRQTVGFVAVAWIVVASPIAASQIGTWVDQWLTHSSRPVSNGAAILFAVLGLIGGPVCAGLILQMDRPPLAPSESPDV